jgi:hypothetical protein
MREKAINAVLNVSFIKTYREAENYAGVIYAAMKWGKKIDAQNDKIKQKNLNDFLAYNK